MERSYFLITARTGFSKWCQGDIDLARTLWGDPQVTRYICASGKFTQEDIVKRLNLEIFNDAKYNVQYWPVFELATGELIGCCGLRPHGPKEYELGFHLRPEFWRQGYATEAAMAVIQYAFVTMKAKKLFAGHNPKNVTSQKVLRKLGFTYICDEFYEPTGQYHPSYELLGNLRIRAAVSEDAEKIGWVHYTAWMETYRGILPDRFLSTRSPEKSVALFRASQCTDVVVAEHGDEIVGFCGWGPVRDANQSHIDGEIYGIYLLNDYKRKSLGQKMLAYAVAQLEAKGFQRIGLWVLADNIDAIRFYEMQGFQKSGICKEANLGRTVSERLYVKNIGLDM